GLGQATRRLRLLAEGEMEERGGGADRPFPAELVEADRGAAEVPILAGVEGAGLDRRPDALDIGVDDFAVDDGPGRVRQLGPDVAVEYRRAAGPVDALGRPGGSAAPLHPDQLQPAVFPHGLEMVLGLLQRAATLGAERG